MNSEELLPLEQRLNTAFAENGDEVRYQLDENARKQAGNIIALDFEFCNVDRLVELARHLEEGITPEESSENFDALYAGVCFASQIVEEIYEQNAIVDTAEYFEKLRQESDPYLELQKDIRDYLLNNPGVSDLIDYYRHTLDKERGRFYFTKLAAGMVFMLVERSQGACYVSEEARNILPTDIPEVD